MRLLAAALALCSTLPVMGAIALGLIFMVAGDQLFFRRRGQLAT